MDGLIHWPPKFNPVYDEPEWHVCAASLEDRMERFAADAVEHERLAAASEDEAMADSHSELAEGSWREYRRLKQELNDLEGGW